MDLNVFPHYNKKTKTKTQCLQNSFFFLFAMNNSRSLPVGISQNIDVTSNDIKKNKKKT